MAQNRPQSITSHQTSFSENWPLSPLSPSPTPTDKEPTSPFPFPYYKPQLQNLYQPQYLYPSYTNQTPRLPFGTNIPHLNPQHIETLVSERNYLLTTLQHENGIARHLLNKIVVLQGQMDLDSNSVRKWGKKMGWLRQRLGEATKQEQAILSRIHELGHEISYAITETPQYPIHHQQRLYAYPTLIPSSPPPHPYHQPYTLDPLTPSFQPLKAFPSTHPSPSPIKWTYTLPSTTKSIELPSISPLNTTPTTDPTEDELLQKLRHIPNTPLLLRRSSSLDSIAVEVFATGKGIPVPKRLSLPFVIGQSGIWAFTQEEERGSSRVPEIEGDE